MTAFRSSFCDGLNRRDFLRVGALGLAGLTLADGLRLEAAGTSDTARSAIFIFQSGGPSHVDSFDVKPDAPAEYRGEFDSIPTGIPGIRFSEHLPQLARSTESFALLRGVSHNIADHELGKRYLATGNRPLFTLEHPFYGSVVNQELPVDRDLPPAVGLPFSPHGPGYLGLEHACFDIGVSPRIGQKFEVRGIDLKRGSVMRFEKWHDLRNDLDRLGPSDEEDQLTAGLDKSSQRAFEVIRSDRTRTALDLSREKESVAREFGDNAFGKNCLLACRLVAAGVRFVSIVTGGWDTHSDNFSKLKNDLLPTLDTGISVLLKTLKVRGLLDSTTVFVTGEFGRTPKINTKKDANGGRDHWPRAMTCLLAGGGIRGGQVLGESDARGEGPKSDAITPDDVAATFYHTLGIDAAKEFHTSVGRPITLVRDGKVLRPLI